MYRLVRLVLIMALVTPSAPAMNLSAHKEAVFTCFLPEALTPRPLFQPGRPLVERIRTSRIFVVLADSVRFPQEFDQRLRWLVYGAMGVEIITQVMHFLATGDWLHETGVALSAMTVAIPPARFQSDISPLYPAPVKRRPIVVKIPSDGVHGERDVDLIESIFDGTFNEAWLDYLPKLPQAMTLDPQKESYRFIEAKAMAGVGMSMFRRFLTYKDISPETDHPATSYQNKYTIPADVMRWIVDLILYSKALKLLLLNENTVRRWAKDNEAFAQSWGFVHAEKRIFVSRAALAPLVQRVQRTVSYSQGYEALRDHGVSIDQGTYRECLSTPEKFVGRKKAKELFGSLKPAVDDFNGIDIAHYAHVVDILKNHVDKRKKVKSSQWTIADIADEIERLTKSPDDPGSKGWRLPDEHLRRHFRVHETKRQAKKSGHHVYIREKTAQAFIKAQVEAILAFQKFTQDALLLPRPDTLQAGKEIVHQHGAAAAIKSFGFSQQKFHGLMSHFRGIRRVKVSIVGLTRSPIVVLVSKEDIIEIFRRVGQALGESDPEIQAALGRRVITSNKNAKSLRRDDALEIQKQVKEQTGWILNLKALENYLHPRNKNVDIVELQSILGYGLAVTSRRSIQAITKEQVAAIKELQQFYKDEFFTNGVLSSIAQAKRMLTRWNVSAVSREAGISNAQFRRYVEEMDIRRMRTSIIGLDHGAYIVSPLALEKHARYQPFSMRRRLEALTHTVSTDDSTWIDFLPRLASHLRRLRGLPVFAGVSRQVMKFTSHYDDLIDHVMSESDEHETDPEKSSVVQRLKKLARLLHQPVVARPQTRKPVSRLLSHSV